LDQLTKLKVIPRLGVGIDNIDIATTQQRDIQSIPNLTFLVSGGSKHVYLKAILDGHVANDKSPANQLIGQAEGQVTILCDHHAWPAKVYD